MEKVSIQVLRSVTNAIFDFIETELKIEDISLENDEYWSIPDDALYKIQCEPSVLDCGSLLDDLHFIKVAYQENAQSIPATLVHLAPILHHISKTIPNYKIDREK